MHPDSSVSPVAIYLVVINAMSVLAIMIQVPREMIIHDMTMIHSEIVILGQVIPVKTEQM